MAYVVYDIESTALVTEKGWKVACFKTEAAAKAARTRMIKCQKYAANTLAIAESNLYINKIKRQVERVNIMTGKTYMEDVNTPRCCSPSSEAYWSM